MAKITGVGGAILKCPDDTAEDRGLTVWHVAEKDSQWFSPSNSDPNRTHPWSRRSKDYD